MKKFISAFLFLAFSATALSQEREVLTLPAATEGFFKQLPVKKVSAVLGVELKTYFSEVELNDKMKEQWGIKTLADLQSLTYPVIIPVLGYHSKDGRLAILGNADQFYVPLFLGNEIKIMASVSRMQDGYHVTNVGWPIMAKQLNSSVSALSSTAHLAYVEMPGLGKGALVSSPSNHFNQSALKVLQVILPGQEVGDTKMAETNFNDFVGQANSQK